MRPLVAIMLVAPLVAAGCVTPPEDVETAAAAQTPGLIPVAQTEFTFDGGFGPGAYACPIVTCIEEFPMDNSGTEADIVGVVTGANLTLTWDATSPTMQAMYLGISWGTEDDEEWEAEYVEGTSPLVLELAGLDIPEDVELWVWAWPVSPVPMGIVGATTPQSFHIEGTFATVEPAPATPAE